MMGSGGDGLGSAGAVEKRPILRLGASRLTLPGVHDINFNAYTIRQCLTPVAQRED